MAVTEKRRLETNTTRRFGSGREAYSIPDLTEIQTRSYARFLQYDTPADKRKDEGLEGVLREIFPIESYDKKLKLDYIRYELGKPRYLDAAAEVYAALPDDWRMLLEHKMFEPAFYSTVISDWGSSILAAQQLGPKAKCLVDLGHHAPNVNIEQIVARLHRFGKLGGFHFNDSKYGDDDLDSGSINPHQLFLVFNELVEAELNPRDGFNPSYMIDQSHNVTDPIESLIRTAGEIRRAYAQALLVDRAALAGFQDENDALMASETLKAGFRLDVEPILAKARLEAGGAIDPIAAYRASGYRRRVSDERPASRGSGGGIV